VSTRNVGFSVKLYKKLNAEFRTVRMDEVESN